MCLYYWCPIGRQDLGISGAILTPPWNWLYQCATVRAPTPHDPTTVNISNNGVLFSFTSPVRTPPERVVMGINLYSGQESSWNLAEYIYWDRALSADELSEASRYYLSSKYCLY